MSVNDFAGLRGDTRGCEYVVHLNNCGASLPPMGVVDKVVEYARDEELLGPYEAATKHSIASRILYDEAALLIGSTSEEIAFCDSASRAFNNFVYALKLNPGDVILTSRLEFGSGLTALQHIAERSGAVVEFLPCDYLGRVDLERLETAIELRKPKLVAITHAAAHSGAINPIEEIGAIVRKTESLYLVDACQSLGQMAVDVHKIGCHALTATGRKWLRGPRGTGFLYVSGTLSSLIDPVGSDLVSTDYLVGDVSPGASRLLIRSDARRFELWERNLGAAIGFGAALQYLNGLALGSINERVLSLAQLVSDGLRAMPGIQVWAPDVAVSGVVGFTSSSASASSIKAACSLQKINISTMSDYDAPTAFADMEATSVARVAPHYFNTEDEVELFLSVIRNVVMTS
jgi:cysteine desulfurase / selenocysteine lyase